jgi:cytochrome P450
MLVFDPHDPRHVTDGVPFDVLASVRREQPVFPTPSGAWYLSTYELVETALRDVDTFRTDLSVHSGLEGVEQVPVEQLFLSEIEEPRHGQIRRIFNATFGPQRLANYEPIVRESCERLVVAWPDDRIVDLHGDYAARIPGLVMAKIMGLPDDIVDRFDKWSRDGTIMARPCSPQFGEGRHPLQNELASELARRRNLPEMPDDVFRRLAQADVGGAPLTDQEIVTQLHFMIQAGVHTTRGLLTHLVNRLLHDDVIAMQLRADPTLVDAFVEESLRHDAPVQRTTRRCTRAATLGDVELQAGDWLEMGIASANRDERLFRDGEEFQLGREDDARHIAFGAGPHVCPGASLARLEGAMAVRVLLERCARLDTVRGATYPPIPGSLGHQPIPARISRASVVSEGDS